MSRLSEFRQTRVYRDAVKEGRIEMIQRLLTQRLGALPIDVEVDLQQLAEDRIADLIETILEFDCLDDLTAWLSCSQNY